MLAMVETDGKISNYGGTTMANNNVIIRNGVIVNNPFSQRLEMSHTAQWMIQNKSLVMSKIWFWFEEFYATSYGGNAEDCFGYGIDYFTESKRRAFRKSYFGRDTTYDVSKYCLSQVRYIVLNYLKDMNNGLELQFIVNSDEKEMVRHGVVEETMNNPDEMCTEDLIESRDIAMWDERYEWLEEYILYFTNKNYKTFDVMGYLTHMYLDVNDEDIDGYIDDHIINVGNKIGESVDMITLVTDDFRRDVNKRDEDALELLALITELVGAVKVGWKPKILRA